jgi:uncharacterized repeat protein (TIGR01451 family)
MQPVRAFEPSNPTTLGLRRRREGQHRSAPRLAAMLGGAVLVVVGAVSLASPVHTAAAGTANPPVAAEGDSYALGGYAQILAGDKVPIGPIAPSVATAPEPLNPDGLNVATLSCSGTSCLTPVVTSVDVTADTSKAFVPGLDGAPASVATTDCNPFATVMPSGFVTGALTGGNACSNIAHVEIGGAGGIMADAISVQSLTQSCTADPVGQTSIADLNIAGTEIPVNGSSIPPNTSLPIPGGLGTVILNEQIAENQSAPGPGGTTQSGRGMTVNAIHVFLLSTSPLNGVVATDVIIGHAHSDAICANPIPTPLCMPGDHTMQCNGVVITKLPDLPIIAGRFTGAPGQSFSYTMKFANVATCPLTQVVDTLPVGFSFVSASGPLGIPTTNQASNGAQVLTWFKGSGWSTPDPLVESLTVKIPADAPPNRPFINEVETLSDCGNNSGSSPPVYVSGSNPSPTPTPSPTATATASVSAATPTATATSQVNAITSPPNGGADPTAYVLPVAGAGALVLAGLGGIGGGFLAGRRRRRRTPPTA